MASSGISLSSRGFLFLQLLNLIASLSVTAGGLIEDGARVSLSGVLGHLGPYAYKFGSQGLPVAICGLLFVLRPGSRLEALRVLRSYRHLGYLLAVAAGGLLFAAAPSYSLVKLVSCVLPFVAVLAVTVQYRFALPGRERAAVLEQHLLGAFALLGLALFLQYRLTGSGGAGGDLYLTKAEVAGQYMVPNIASATSGFAILLALYTLTRELRIGLRFGPTALASVTLLISLWAFVALNTRGAIVGLVIALALAPVLARGRRITPLRLALGLALFAGGAILLFQSQHIATLLARKGETHDFWSLTGRVWLWERAFADWTPRRALTGYGFASISEQIGISDWWTGGRAIAGAHNAYLQVLFGTGIFGLLCFVRFLFEVWLVGTKQEHGTAFTCASLLFFAVFCLSEHLFGLNITPAFACLVLVYESACARAPRLSSVPRELPDRLPAESLPATPSLV